MNYKNHIRWPHIDIPSSYGLDYDGYLCTLVYDGAHKRYGRDLSSDCIGRIELELNYIKRFCCAQYFIILSDIVKYARENEIWIGAGRGRTVSSIICYCLFIDDIDPIKFGLSSFRVCWKEEDFFPDVDIDVSKAKRNQLFDYIRNKFGELAVYRIKPNTDLFSKVHPCTIMILDEKSIDHIRKEKMFVEDEDREVLVADICKRQLDEKGYLNYDLLEMKHVDLVGDVCKLIEKKYGTKIDLVNLDITDNNVLAIFCEGDTDDIFQFDCSGLEKYLQLLEPSSFSDLVALNSLYRPGLLDWIPDYICRKNEVEVIPDFASANYILKSTYGIPIYRDQIIQILTEIGNISYDISNKIYMLLARRKEITQYESLFRDGCLKQGIRDSESEMLWDFVLTYSGFTFDKSHAVAYTYIAFQQAWLKTYYPSEFHEISSAFQTK